jgi:hypothetical protein
MTCPYLRKGKFRNHCVAYLGDIALPSLYEDEYLCHTCSHTECVWYVSKGRETLDGSVLCPAMVECLVDFDDASSTDCIRN